MTNQIETEVLVIGCGIAGGTVALTLADAGIPVTVVTRTSDPQESNTYYAQGGIIYQGEQDSPGLLIEDVMRAGGGYSQAGAVSILAEQGPPLVREILLDRVQVSFDRNGGRKLSLAREGGHSLPRIIHAADATGRAISTALLQALAGHPQVTLLPEYTAVELIRTEPPSGRNGQTGDGPAGCRGAYLLDQAGGRIIPCLAGNTVLATGGLGQLFIRTTNPAGARGDGVAMADRLGARVGHMEFVQFHPTAFYQPGAFPFLISEAVRGAGARLVDVDGRPFMENYEPDWKDLAPRDVVARSIHQEMMAQGVPNVYLDLASYIPRSEILGHFPNIYQHCLTFGIDVTQDLVPVVPAAHYACGGVEVDGWGQTSLDHLYAVGEVAYTGVHGANRLASTSLLEGLVWGYRAGSRIKSCLNGHAGPSPAGVEPFGGGSSRPEPGQIERYTETIRRLMWEQVGLVRTDPCLAYALGELRYLRGEIEQLYQRCRPTDELAGLRNMAQVALLITAAATENRVGVGCHYRV